MFWFVSLGWVVYPAGSGVLLFGVVGGLRTPGKVGKGWGCSAGAVCRNGARMA